MADWLQKQWKGYSIWHLFLLPLSIIFLLLSSGKKQLFRFGVLKSHKLSVPVIVVGNISVGGTGKTPLVIWLANQLKQKGFKPGIVSRGYGGSANDVTEVFAHSMPNEVGDEPLLIAKHLDCPVFVGLNRVDACMALLEGHPDVNVIISDDGLQHYRLQRDIEIAVVDSQRGFGNALLLPAGPLREAKSRLNKLDAIVITNANQQSSIKTEFLAPVFEMGFAGDVFISLFDGISKYKAGFFNGKSLVAVAGIGNPKRFFEDLTKMGLVFEQKSFPDHHAYTPQDLSPLAGKTILMTEKDAVKCEQFVKGNAQYDIWMLPVSANIVDGLNKLVLQKLATLSKGK
jgi:tetraacyldisaccharide 4'-kinase